MGDKEPVKNLMNPVVIRAIIEKINIYVGMPKILEDSPIPRRFTKVITPTQIKEIIILYHMIFS